MIDPILPHERDVTHTVHENIPKHPPRGEYDDGFYESERKTVLDRSDGCWVCGRDESDLKHDDGFGRYLETHHWAVEWSLWNAIDPEDVQSIFDSWELDFYGFCSDLDGKPVKHPGDRRNLLVLCPRHHRYAPDPDKGFGIHNGPWPLWMAQKSTKDGYQLVGSD